jgi:GNAT superfamily N-acetyltransferase
MIRELLFSDFDSILTVVNEAAQAYKGVIPEDRWKEPYMSAEELKEEIASGVRFYGWADNNTLVGVMGIQHILDVTLIRHSYVLKRYQREGIGRKLLGYMISIAETPEILVGTWKDASWAIHFYEANSFKLTTNTEKDKLLKKYWRIPDRQIETSVVLKLKR